MKNNKIATKKAPILKKTKLPISNKIAKAVSSVKKISERIIGYIQYDVQFVRAKYTGKTQKPAKITALEKGVIGILLVDDYASFERIGTILGLDVVNDKAERAILDSAIKTLRGFNAIEGDDSCIALTNNGRTYAEKGERPEKYTSTFELYIDTNHPTWLDIKAGIGKNSSKISEINTPCSDLSISLDVIRSYAEKQATNVHFPQERFLLETANWEEGHEATYKIYVCFVQNVANSDDVRVFVYDENTEDINIHFSNQLNSDESLKKELLSQCITLECEVENETTILKGDEVENAIAEITDEIRQAELSLIQEEAQSNLGHISETDTKTCSENEVKLSAKNRLRKKALYDSLSFELELHKMFTEDDADEIWLISPWIRQTAFMHERGPMIEAFLQDENKKVFIAYSEPAKSNDDKPMVDESVEPKIQLLEDQYPNFFYVQLPEFHLKNVFEVRGDQIVLFSGSFNVLSFSVSENQTHIRREEMTLAHHTIAKRKYEDFQLEFAQIYAKRIKSQIEALKREDLESFKSEKLDYFLSIDNAEINQLFSPLQDMIEEQAIVALKDSTLKRLTSLDQQLVVARNLGGANIKDKKRYGEELDSIKKIINDNLALNEDPSVEEHLQATSEKLDTLPLKAIFPGKEYRHQHDRQTFNPIAQVSTIQLSSLIAKAYEIVGREEPTTKEGLWALLLSITYLFLKRKITKVQLQTYVKSIVLNMDNLYDGLKVETSRTNDSTTNVTFFINGNGISINNLFLGNMRAKYEEHVKFARIPRIQWVNNKNVELILNQI